MKIQDALRLVVLTCGLAQSLAAQIQIITTKGSYGLIPPEDAVSEGGLNSIVQTAKLAGDSLAADIQDELKDVDELERTVTVALTEYQDGKDSYNKAYEDYKKRNNDNIGLAKTFNDEAKAFNARAKQEQDSETAGKLAKRKEKIDGERKQLDRERDSLKTRLAEVVANRDRRNAALIKLKAAQIKLGHAYAQLKLCQSYGERATKVSLEKKWGAYRTAADVFGTLKIIPSMELLNGRMENLKALSDRAMDGRAP